MHARLGDFARVLQTRTRLGCLGVLIPQDASEDFPARALGYGLDKLDTALKSFVSRLVVFNVLQKGLCDLFLRNALCLGGRNDESPRNLARLDARDADYSAVGHEGMLEEVGLELCGCDLMSLHNMSLHTSTPGGNTYLDFDELLEAVHDDQLLIA